MSIDAFYGLNNLQSLRLERCLLRHMPPIAHVKDTLLSLFVPGNLIAYISDGYFEDFRDLTVLSVAKNYLTQFPDVSPIYQTLHTLSLHSNRIRTIPSFMVDNTFIALKYLMLWENNIHAIPTRLLSHCPNLRELLINDNNLRTLDHSVFEGNHSTVRVTLSGNPWRCDSALAWLCDLHFENYNNEGFVTQFKTFKRAGIPDYGRLICTGPDLYDGIKIIHLSMSEPRLQPNTVYPKKYAHGFVVLWFVVVMQSFIMNSEEVFIHIHQGCFAGTGAIVRLPQCQWSKPDGCGKISQCRTTAKHSKQKPCAYFLGYTVYQSLPMLCIGRVCCVIFAPVN